MGTQPVPDDEIDIELRSAEEIGARLVILASLLQRLDLESSPDRDEAASELFDLQHWLNDEGIARHMTAEEQRLIGSRIGALSEGARAQGGLIGDSLVAIGRAVCMVDAMPPYDTPAAPTAIVESIPSPWDEVAPFSARLVARTEGALAAERERADLWLWRAETERERVESRGATRTEIEALIREIGQDVAAIGLIETNAAHDFIVRDDGPSIRDLPSDAAELVAGIAESRLHALNWLCGFGNAWDNVPLDV
jgi:hypothetical protein